MQNTTSIMKERPILFSAPMVRAILAGQKTQTRRIVRPRVVPIVEECFLVNGKWCNHTFDYDLVALSPYGCPSDRLWVKETWGTTSGWDTIKPTELPEFRVPIRYRADGAEWDGAWRPSLFMRRWMSRITVEIKSIRVERLQDITKGDAKDEGIERVECGDHQAWKNYSFKTAHPKSGVTITDQEHRILGYESPCASYMSLWESINGPGSWVLNPWVWVIEFKRV
jgi:hypothetical protein